MNITDQLDYQLVGACTFLSDETLKIMGYGNYKNLYPERNHAVLAYSKSPDMDGILFGDLDGIKKLIHPEIIKDKYPLKIAEELYPELFI